MTNRIQGSATEPARRRVVKKPTAGQPPKKRDSIPASKLPTLGAAWVIDCTAGAASKSYIEACEFIVAKFDWWSRRTNQSELGADAIREFILYCQTAHTLPEGRWGEPGETRQSHDATRQRGYKPVSERYRPISARTAANYWKALRTLYAWMVSQGQLDTSPFSTLKAPIARSEQIRPMDSAELQKLIEAAGRSKFAKRDKAIILFMVDTGVRASELCGLVWKDVDTVRRAATVLGKGNKRREVYWSAPTGRALWQWAQEIGIEQDAPVFCSLGGNTPGSALTRGGLQKIIGELGKSAQLPESLRCSPHTLRHTFAVMFLRAGGSQFALMDALGHTNLEMSRKYVQFTGADRANQARQFSPVANLSKKRS